MKCIKSLFKSTYNNYAFKKGYDYIVYLEEDKIVYMLDEEGNLISFSKTNTLPFYFLQDYFK